MTPTTTRYDPCIAMRQFFQTASSGRTAFLRALPLPGGTPMQTAGVAQDYPAQQFQAAPLWGSDPLALLNSADPAPNPD